MSSIVTWIDPSGTSYDLDDGTSTFVEAKSLNGLLTPSYSYSEVERAIYPGSKVIGVKTLARDLDLAVLVKKTTRSDLVTYLQNLVYAFDPTRGEGTLRVTFPTGVVRDLHCRCVRGMDTPDSGFSYRQMILTFRAGDPYWYSVTPTVLTYTRQVIPANWFPIFPLMLCNTSSFSTSTIVNAGKVETWPVWSIAGPGSTPTIINSTTGKSLVFSTTLLATDILDVDTRPGYKSVKLNGAYRFDLMSGELWPLASGNNTVTVSLGAATDVSRFQLTYYDLYQ